MKEFKKLVLTAKSNKIYKLEDNAIEKFDNFYKKGIVDSKFFWALFCNDFIGVIRFANAFQLIHLPAYAVYLHDNIPHICWGTKNRVERWIKKRTGHKLK